jgi:uncharacterized RDD family membrane protein YckC
MGHRARLLPRDRPKRVQQAECGRGVPHQALSSKCRPVMFFIRTSTAGVSRFWFSGRGALSNSVESESVEPAYGRFSRRIRALVIDWIITLLLLVTVLCVAISADSDRIGRILGFTFLGIWLLYEPLLVSVAGSTIGHYRTNLRVVDNRSRGNIGFLKAVVRVIIKSVLGPYSFITMATTSRHQALHDLLTRSTVQIRDLSKASTHHYVHARTELLNPAMPSGWRRMLVIILYLAGVFVVVLLVMSSLVLAHLLSDACIHRKICSASEKLVQHGLVLSWFGISIWCIIQGWRGRLFGCRPQVERTQGPDLSRVF